MTPNTQDIRIFIIDDDADDTKLLIEAVGEIDKTIECMSARDGQQALDILKDASTPLPQLIFLDLRMPRLGGKKCLLEIKSDQYLKDIPVVIYTTSRGVEEAAELQALGAVNFISKPSDPEEIFYIVSVVLEEELKGSFKKHN